VDLVRSSDEFDLYRLRITGEVWLGDVFPRRVLKRTPLSTRFFESAYLTGSRLFEMVRSLFNDFNEDGKSASSPPVMK
jgi:hypothetical protein